jgi:hypothetical protein
MEFILFVIVALIILNKYFNSNNSSPKTLPKLEREQFNLFLRRIEELGLKPEIIEEINWRFEKDFFSCESDLIDFLKSEINKQNSKVKAKSTAELSRESQDYWMREAENGRDLLSTVYSDKQLKSSVDLDSSFKKKLRYEDSESKTRFCSNCGKEIYAHTTYVVERYESVKSEDIIFPKEGKVFCSYKCANDSWEPDDGNTAFGNWK